METKRKMAALIPDDKLFLPVPKAIFMNSKPKQLLSETSEAMNSRSSLLRPTCKKALISFEKNRFRRIFNSQIDFEFPIFKTTNAKTHFRTLCLSLSPSLFCLSRN